MGGKSGGGPSPYGGGGFRNPYGGGKGYGGGYRGGYQPQQNSYYQPRRPGGYGGGYGGPRSMNVGTTPMPQQPQRTNQGRPSAPNQSMQRGPSRPAPTYGGRGGGDWQAQMRQRRRAPQNRGGNNPFSMYRGNRLSYGQFHGQPGGNSGDSKGRLRAILGGKFGGMPAGDNQQKGTYVWDYSKNQYVHKPFDAAAHRQKQLRNQPSGYGFGGPDDRFGWGA